VQARAEQGHAGDSVQRALRSRFPPRLMPGVSRLESWENDKNDF